MLQKTISKEISITGIGQHKGTENTITLKPADINTGITFIIKGKVFPFTIENVYGEAGYTTIGDLEKENVKVLKIAMDNFDEGYAQINRTLGIK